jgi:hypothetical protein
MSLAKGIVGAAVGGAVGVAVWAGLSYVSGWGLGLLGIVVGGLVGFGMGQGNEGRGGLHAGLGAGAVALLAVLCGRFVTTQIWLHNSMEEHAGLTSEDAVDVLARRYYEEMSAAGEEFDDWDGEGWPEIVQYRATTAWNRMSEEERGAMVAELEAEQRADMEEAAPMVGLIAFLFATLRPSGLLLLALSVSTAYKIGSQDVRAEAAARGLEVGPAAAGATAAAASRPKPGRAPAAPEDEPVGGGYALPMCKEEKDDLPSIEDIRRKHAAESGGAPSEAA